MRGGFIHNTCLVAPLVAFCRSAGASVTEELPVGPGRGAGHVDAVIELGRCRVAVEVECSARRIANDLEKAARLGVQELWIVVPDRRVAKAVRASLRRVHEPAFRGDVFVLSQLQARDRLAISFPLIAAAKVRGTEWSGG